MICKNIKKCTYKPVNKDNICSQCREESDNKTIKLEEKRVSYYINNSSKDAVVKFHVDGGIVRDANQKKCDYLVCIRRYENLVAVFVELKGSDIEYGISQIKESLDLVASQLSGYSIKARLVYGKIPAHELSSATSIRIRKAIKKIYGDIFELRKSGTEETF